MSYYVRRYQPRNPDRICWTGPLADRGAALVEKAVWEETGWIATVHATSHTVRAWVRHDQRREAP